MLNETLEQRLIEIEHRLAHAERTAEDLSGIVAKQASQIDLLNRKVAALTQRLQDAPWESSPQD
ncbi:MAG TPA: SlyX family protein, partial [Alphaproteobacteria bacterium]